MSPSQQDPSPPSHQSADDSGAMTVAGGTTTAPDSPEEYESAHVHAVYQAIAPHFSSTRHKAWPRVSSFLLALPPGSVGLDVGCGNGKYLPVNRHVHIFGSDRSENLVRLARRAGQPPGGSSSSSSSKSKNKEKKGEHDEHDEQHKRAATPQLQKQEVAVADGLSLPYRASSVDFCICIAVIHHISTPARRRAAIAELLSLVRGGGRVMLFVWALEQASSRRGWDEGSHQDTLVPWVYRAAGDDEHAGKTFQRYYHLYREGELEDDVKAAGGVVLEGGYERDNWWVVCTPE
ncbi:hypothetical protein N3K66_003613 [Trichothecium roseum]|uniref:Uncharacterized protein n=1 Tax=Trichothecium roseum TaxID=47278 RepID=A0ACC0V5V7_9HYPO|nr:hypothetical protein N3K66_003613 [Trichothecium roseum]